MTKRFGIQEASFIAITAVLGAFILLLTAAGCATTDKAAATMVVSVDNAMQSWARWYVLAKREPNVDPVPLETMLVEVEKYRADYEAAMDTYLFVRKTSKVPLDSDRALAAANAEGAALVSLVNSFISQKPIKLPPK